MKSNNIYGIVMAGGKGERFWPQSRISHPKQLLRLIGNLTLIEQTVQRLLPLIVPENIIVITNTDYTAPMQSLLSALPPGNIIGEPVGKDTAPCVALATAIVKARHAASRSAEEPVMVMLPADHIIRDTSSMLKVISDSVALARQDGIVTIGIDPAYPSTGYGYIHCGEELSSPSGTKFYRSLGFKEKPDMATAKDFLKDKSYKWNSGMFIWSLKTIYTSFRKFAPAMADKIDLIEKAVDTPNFPKVFFDTYQTFEKISIDYAIMEKAENVSVAQASFDWDDVGSWTALRNQIRPEPGNNVIRGLHQGIDTKDCIIVGDSKHLIATVDIEDLIVVHTDDATLICNAKSAQKIKDLVRILGVNAELAKFT